MAEKERQFHFDEGAVYDTVHTTRQVRIYPLSKSELKTVATLNRLTVLFSSIGTGLAGFVLSSAYDALKSPDSISNWASVVAVWTGLLILSGASYGYAYRLSSNKDSVIEDIESEVKDKSATQS